MPDIESVAPFLKGLKSMWGWGKSSYTVWKGYEGLQTIQNGLARQLTDLAFMDNMNAELSRFNSAIGEISAEEEVSGIYQQTRDIIGTQRAIFASRGLNIERGSPLAVIGETARMGNKRAQNVMFNKQVALLNSTISSQIASRMFEAKREEITAERKKANMQMDAMNFKTIDLLGSMVSTGEAPAMDIFDSIFG